jgi:transcriptional regulator with GAF, ATPase, and Fis domain
MDDIVPAEHGGAEAQATIARQAEEIAHLRRRVADERTAEDVREALILAATAGTIASPVTHSRLLEMIVETAAQVISARAASLFLIDEETQELVFEVALGQKAEEVKKFRVPIGHGIAGLVAMSGQPMSISDAKSDPRQAADIAKKVDYVPESILCVPLFYNDQIIGVLELLDKDGAPSFSTTDMESLGLFANQAAVAIEQSRTHRNLASLIGEVLGSLGSTFEQQSPGLQQRAHTFASHIEEHDVAYLHVRELAQLVREIASHGEREVAFCRTFLQGYAEYLRIRRNPLTELGALT